MSNYTVELDIEQIDRTDPALVQVVEELGEAANADSAENWIAGIIKE